MKDYIVNLTYQLYSQTWIKAIRRGLLKIQPLILIACLIIIIVSIDIDYYNNMMASILGDKWNEKLNEFYVSIYIVTKLALVVTISYSLTNLKNQKDENITINPIISSIIGLISIVILTIDDGIYNIDYFSAKTSLISIVFSLIATEIYIYVYKLRYRYNKKLELSYDRIVKESIYSFIPTLITILALFLIKPIGSIGLDILGYILINIDRFLQDIFYYIPTLNEIKYIFYTHILWFLGGHGGDIINLSLMFNKSYIDAFVNLGGAGATICLILAIFINKSGKYSKGIAKAAIIPSIFNINEIILYGLPIVFNPVYIVPFILTPIVLTYTTYIAHIIGFISVTDIVINWTTPIFFNAYLLTGSINGILLQIINLIIGVCIYMPFIAMSEKISEKEDKISYEELKNTIVSNNIYKSNITQRDDSIGQIAHSIGVDLYNDLINNNLYLEYQPQVNKSGNVVGVEALLRWKHKTLGNISPNVIIVLAEELNIINELGKWIIKESCTQLSKWNKEHNIHIDMSINISSTQLRDKAFFSYIKSQIVYNNLNPNNVKIEITETLMLGEDDNTKEQIKMLDKFGVKLVIDDFGVGYNPILYIKKYNISAIKIDGSLIKDIDKNKDSKEIVHAMYTLAKNSKIKIIDEFVETESQKNILDKMGDGIYQGYLFSKPLKPDECIKYIKNNI